MRRRRLNGLVGRLRAVMMINSHMDFDECTFQNEAVLGQTISHSIIDTPPSGRLTPFSVPVYVALSRGRGRDNIRLLRDFNEKLMKSHRCEHLRNVNKVGRGGGEMVVSKDVEIWRRTY